jgi:hypothetical protein
VQPAVRLDPGGSPDRSNHLAGADSDDASPVLASSLRRHILVAPHCLRLDVARPRPPARTEAIGGRRALRTNPSRPAQSTPSWADRAPLLRFASPSAYVSRVASSCPPGGRPGGRHPASALFASARPRTSPGMIPARTSVTAAQVAPAVFRSSADHRVARLERRTVGVGRSIVANVASCAAVRQHPRHAFVDREDATPVVFDPSCGWRSA